MIPGLGILIHYRRDRLPASVFLDFFCSSAGKESAAMRETWVQSLDWEDPLEKGKATHSSILACTIPAWFKQADRQAGKDSRADGFPPVSGGAPGPQ